MQYTSAWFLQVKQNNENNQRLVISSTVIIGSRHHRTCDIIFLPHNYNFSQVGLGQANQCWHWTACSALV
jgi:hypothetical protein